MALSSASPPVKEFGKRFLIPLPKSRIEWYYIFENLFKITHLIIF